LPIYKQDGVWIAECPECGFRGEKDNEKSAEMLLVRHAALCPARKKEREKAKSEAGAVTTRTGEEEIPQTFGELVEQVMTDYGIRPEVIERVKRRVAHTNKYERDPVQFRRLLEGQRLKQSTVQMIVEDVFDEYVGRGAAGPYMEYDYAWKQHAPYGTPYHYGAPYPVPSPVRERVIERPLPSGGVERVIYVGSEREKDYSSLERRLDRIERMLGERRHDNPGGTAEVTVTEPMRDEQGRLITGEDGKPIYKIMKGPANLVGGISDFRDRLLERVVLEQTKSKGELTTEDIRKIIRDEIRTRETGPKETVSRGDLERFKKDTVETVKKLFEERETEDRLARIEKDLKDIKTGAVGQVSEEGRIRLTALTEGVGAVEKQMENFNRTITNLVNMFPKLLRLQTPEGTRVPVSEAEIERAAERLEEKIAETGEAESKKEEVDFIA